MNLYIDIDNTICRTDGTGPDKYEKSAPIYERIAQVNILYDEGNTITYWTARGGASGINYEALTHN